MYFATVDSASSNPSFRSSPWTSTRVGEADSANQVDDFPRDGRSALRMATLPLQYNLNPRRCHAITVSGLTITRADRQPFQSWESQTQRSRPATLSRSLRSRLVLWRTSS